MKTNPNDSAFARPYSHDERPFTGMVEGDYAQSFYANDGLTKREYFAAMALQGLCVQGAYDKKLQLQLEELNTTTSVMIATYAVDIADALIAELNKINPK